MVSLFGIEELFSEITDSLKDVAGEVVGEVKDLGDELKDTFKLDDQA